MPRRRLVSLLLGLFTLVTFFASHPALAQEPTDQRAMPEMEKEYIVGPSDILEVQVWREDNLTRSDRLVLPDGTLALPLIDNVPAGGKTLKELKLLIQKMLEKFVDAPRVYLTVKAPNSHSFNILGNVREPGRYPMLAPTTVLQGISMAKGFNEWASKNKTVIVRGHGKKQIILPFEYDDVVDGDKPEQNFVMLPGDTIVVP